MQSVMQGLGFRFQGLRVQCVIALYRGIFRVQVVQEHP